ncbi:MAG: DUF4139 domain-containing protein [Anaerolineae bacterium]|nr:DUF4139 domain-containing protein [Anaerolineae bacterium]
MKRLLTLAFIASLVAGVAPAMADDVSVRYESTPDEAVLYLGDLVYVRDTVSLPPGDVTVTFPATVIADSLIVSEDGARVRLLRFRNAARSVAVADPWSSAMSVPIEASPLAVSWPSEATETREVVLEYLARGASWRPLYDMTVLDEETVRFAFTAEIVNYTLALDDAAVKLVSGMVGGDSEAYAAMMTMAQNALGYENVVNFERPEVGQISAHHVYDLGAVTMLPGETVRVSMVDEMLDARRIIAWDTRQGERTEVIYKVANTSAFPFSEGMVRAYEDGIYLGTDAIEWTPSGSEGSVTVAGMSDVRVRRQESVEEIAARGGVDEYRHEVTLEIGNYGGEDITLAVLDPWPNRAVEFSFSAEPSRQPGNIFRWDVDAPAGERVTITYTFYTD